MPRRRDKTRPRPRWVYRGHLSNLLSGQTIAQDNETYDITAFALPSSSGFQAFTLYDSDLFVGLLASNTGAGQGFAAMPPAARPAGERARCLAVAGQVIIEPSSWAIGNHIEVGMRIGVLEQDTSDGAFIGLPGYSMWGISYSDQPAQHALGIHNLWERRFLTAFNAEVTTPVFTIPLFARLNGKRGITLSPRHGLSFGMETNSASVGIRTRLFLRTLVSDDA